MMETTTTPITDLLCPAGPFTVRVTTKTKQDLLDAVATYSHFHLDITGEYDPKHGYTTRDLRLVQYWRTRLGDVIDADWHERDAAEYPVQITPALHQPAALVELQEYQPQFFAVLDVIEHAFKANQRTAELVTRAEGVLDRWKERASYWRDVARGWQEQIHAERPVRDEARDETADEAYARWEVARRNAELIARQASTDMVHVIDGWRGIADDIARTGRVPDFD